MILFWPLSEERATGEAQGLGGARVGAGAGAAHEPLRRQHLLRRRSRSPSGEELILDAGTGIRNLGLDLNAGRRIHILLTHLHLDHIQGLMFFPPCFRPESEITIWGPSSPEASLEDRIARYISAPLSPVEVRELPCSVSFRDTPATEWELGGATIRAEAVTHRGPDARLPDHRRRDDGRLHPRPRAGARRAARPGSSRSGSRASTSPATPTC